MKLQQSGLSDNFELKTGFQIILNYKELTAFVLIDKAFTDTACL
jgi:hypothetical protein